MREDLRGISTDRYAEQVNKICVFDETKKKFWAAESESLIGFSRLAALKYGQGKCM